MKKTIILITILLSVFVFTVIALASNGGYQIAWFTIDAGGGQSTGGDYALTGTIGQPEASSPANGDSYTLTGGFWSGLAQPPCIFLPLVQRR